MKITKEHKLHNKFEHVMTMLRGKTLDIGCGPGIFNVKAILNGHDMEGLDISIEALKEATKNAKDSGVVFPTYLTSIHDLPQAKKYDTILMLNIVEHLYKPVEGIKAAYELLEEGGQLIINVPAGFAHYDQDHKNFFFTREDIRFLEDYWMFRMMPHVFMQAATIIIVEEFLSDVTTDGLVARKHWVDSEHPSANFLITLNKPKGEK